MEVQLYGKAYLETIDELNLSSKDLKYIDPNIKYFKNLDVDSLIYFLDHLDNKYKYISSAVNLAFYVMLYSCIDVKRIL